MVQPGRPTGLASDLRRDHAAGDGERARGAAAGTPAEGLLDHGLPRLLAAVADPDLVVAIDCPPGQVPSAIGWTLAGQQFDAALSAELRQRAEALARTLASATESAQSTGPANGRVAR